MIDLKAGASRLALSGAALAMLGFAMPAHAEGTAAGTVIVNTAQATHGDPGNETTVTSNTVSLRVDELLDVAVASRDSGDVSTTPGATAQVLAFTVTNAGNGSEAFTLAAVSALGGDNFDPDVTSVVLDANGNDQYDAGIDTVYVAGSNDPVLAADGSLTVFILSSIDNGATDTQRGQARLTATAVTGSGPAGTVFTGAGAGGGDALTGATTATALAGGFYAVSAASVALVKSATVVDPFGGGRALPGSIVTYRLVATATGSGSVPNLRVTDAIPVGTTYDDNTMTLDGIALSDVADADAGAFSGSGVAVALGTVAGGASRTIEFKVTID